MQRDICPSTARTLTQSLVQGCSVWPLTSVPVCLIWFELQVQSWQQSSGGHLNIQFALCKAFTQRPSDTTIHTFKVPSQNFTLPFCSWNWTISELLQQKRPATSVSGYTGLVMKRDTKSVFVTFVRAPKAESISQPDSVLPDFDQMLDGVWSRTPRSSALETVDNRFVSSESMVLSLLRKKCSFAFILLYFAWSGMHLSLFTTKVKRARESSKWTCLERRAEVVFNQTSATDEPPRLLPSNHAAVLAALTASWKQYWSDYFPVESQWREVRRRPCMETRGRCAGLKNYLGVGSGGVKCGNEDKGW